MQFIGRIESIEDDLEIKRNPNNPSEIQSVVLTVQTFAPSGTFVLRLDKELRSSAQMLLEQFEGQKCLFSAKYVDMDLDSGRFKAWQMSKLPQFIDFQTRGLSAVSASPVKQENKDK